MGGRQSSQKGEMKDVLEFFEEELNNWKDNIKNLKESWEKGDRSWVPTYLLQRMQETEIRWSNIKSLIPLGGNNEGHTTYPTSDTGIGRCCQDALSRNEAEINRLKKNNAIVLGNKEKAERQVQEQKKIIDELQKAQTQMPRNGDALQAKQMKKEQRDPFQPVNQDLKQSIQQSEDEHSSAKDMLIDTLRKQTSEMEEKFQRETSELQKKNEELVILSNELRELIRHLEKDKDDLLARNKELAENTNIRDTERANQRHKEEVQKSKEENQSPKDHIVQKLQKQNRDMEEYFKVEKLKMLEENQLLTAKNSTLITEVDELQKEKDTLLLRLSKVAGEKLTKNNSGITDLSDPNRPTKLGEVYSEIYDNEWTDAYEALTDDGHKDEAAIETLRLTLQHVMQFCESNADLLIKKSSDAVNLLFGEYHKPASDMKMPAQLTMPQRQAREVGKLFREQSSIEDIKFQQRWKPITATNDGIGKTKQSPGKAQMGEESKLDVDNKLKQLRREMATYMVPIVQKAYMDANWSKEYIEGLKPYILKCVFIAWMMIVQSPPMSLHKYPCGKETKFDKNLYKEYTSSGPLVSYVVWPALLLKEDGPVVCKGVAECKKPFPAVINRSTNQNS